MTYKLNLLTVPLVLALVAGAVWLTNHHLTETLLQWLAR